MSGEGRAERHAAGMGELIGYARCSTVLQDLTTARDLASLGVPPDPVDLGPFFLSTRHMFFIRPARARTRLRSARRRRAGRRAR
jgi:hypothetical protein